MTYVITYTEGPETELERIVINTMYKISYMDGTIFKRIKVIDDNIKKINIISELFKEHALNLVGVKRIMQNYYYQIKNHEEMKPWNLNIII